MALSSMFNIVLCSDFLADFHDFTILISPQNKSPVAQQKPLISLSTSPFLSLPLSLASAGIGRTGVLITMETAMCLMECSQPVCPLDIVRTMRDQRAMMIQTPVSPLLHTHSLFVEFLSICCVAVRGVYAISSSEL